MPRHQRLEDMTKEQLIRKIKTQKKQTAYAWGQYFNQLGNQIEQVADVYQVINENIINTDVPKHIETKFKDLMKKYNHLYECPICIEQLNRDDLQFINCGHFFHKECIKKWVNSETDNHNKCPNCRKTINKYKIESINK